MTSPPGSARGTDAAVDLAAAQHRGARLAAAQA